MRIDTIPADYLINAPRDVTCDGDPFVRSDMLLRAVRLTNTSENPLQVNTVALHALANGVVCKTVMLSAGAIRDRASRAIDPMLDAFEKNADNELADLGTSGFWHKAPFSTDSVLVAGQATGFTLEHLLVVADAPIDAIQVIVACNIGGRALEAESTVPVIEYHPHNEYILPVQGSWLVINNWDDLHGHREAISGEFAIDLVQPFEDGLFPLDRENADYGFYGCDVLAAADGEVVVVKDFCPENPKAGVRADLDVGAVYREHGMRSITAGNHVIIQHAGGEHSFYAHLIQGSIPVQVGDRVTQGMRIGALGNSGNSDAPHLHFHLMKGPELGARGLPCRFSNIVDTFGHSCELIEQNFSMIKTLD